MLRLLKQREKLLLFNQKYWGKLAWKEWLVNGDRNSKYFQNKATARWKRKLVVKIKYDFRIYVDEHKMIAEKFITDYTYRFKLAHITRRNLLELGLPKLFTESN